LVGHTLLLQTSHVIAKLQHSQLQLPLLYNPPRRRQATPPLVFLAHVEK
jgi:hypothetical protein